MTRCHATQSPRPDLRRSVDRSSRVRGSGRFDRSSGAPDHVDKRSRRAGAYPSGGSWRAGWSLALAASLLAIALCSGGCTLLEDPDDHFRATDVSNGDSGDSGNGDVAMGGTCDRYCEQFIQVCGDHPSNSYADMSDCLTQCATLPEGNTTDYARDSVFCRINHLGGATIDPDTHCPHASFLGASDPNACGTEEGNCQCIGTEVTPCESYCGLLAENCPAEFEALESEMLNATANCIAECGAFVPSPGGEGVDIFVTDSVECHSAFLDRMEAPNQPAQYCDAAKPQDADQLACRGSQPAIETLCEGFCLLSQQECPSDFAFFDFDACLQGCQSETEDDVQCALDAAAAGDCGSIDPIATACGSSQCMDGADCGEGCVDVEPSQCPCSGALVCEPAPGQCLQEMGDPVAMPGELDEVCGNSLDDNCDGTVDEADCTMP